MRGRWQAQDCPSQLYAGVRSEPWMLSVKYKSKGFRTMDSSLAAQTSGTVTFTLTCCKALHPLAAEGLVPFNEAIGSFQESTGSACGASVAFLNVQGQLCQHHDTPCAPGTSLWPLHSHLGSCFYARNSLPWWVPCCSIPPTRLPCGPELQGREDGRD